MNKRARTAFEHLTIIRHVFGVNFVMLYMFINIPLLTAAFFVMRSRRYVINSFIYVVVFSVSSIRIVRNTT